MILSGVFHLLCQPHPACFNRVHVAGQTLSVLFFFNVSFALYNIICVPFARLQPGGLMEKAEFEVGGELVRPGFQFQFMRLRKSFNCSAMSPLCEMGLSWL
jgi:hypothetical protein